tara:strand:+ start:430 stop:1035 length:606 start_codon:yes stop_codon:yes gene_type:complete
MVITKNLKNKYALVSVFDKRYLRYLCTNLKKYNYKFISTGSTGNKIRGMGFKCKDVSKITKYKEMLDGRVKTINPLIYSSLLYKRENEFHKKQFLSLKIPEIDIVIVNLYPFHKYLKKKDINDIIEMIDIGGPSLLRASGKNFKYVTPIMDVKDYKKLISNLKKNNGMTDVSFRKKMARKIYKGTSSYDKIIYGWLDENQK